MLKKIIGIWIFGLLIFGSSGVLGINISSNEVSNFENDIVVVQDNDGIIFSRINVEALENMNNGGYQLSYFILAIGDHDAYWNIDYTVWFDSGKHIHGIQNGDGFVIPLGSLFISFGKDDYYWDDFNAGSFQANLIMDGDVATSDYDDDEDYDGDFGVDAGEEYEGIVGEPVQFYGSAWGGVEPYSWLWYFGDGNTSTEQNPQHTYMSKGEYEVLLTLSDANGSNAWDDTEVEIEIEDDDDDDYEFEVDAGDDYEGSVEELIQFYGYAEGGEYPYTWLWYFGDGTNSTEQNPQHSYLEEGEYHVMLIVTDSLNNIASDDTEVEIENEEDEDEFEADAGGDYEAEVNEIIQFYGRAEGGVEPYSWFWDFGDGTNSTEQNPQHAYSFEGEYEVILTVTDNTSTTAVDDTEAEIENQDDDDDDDEDDGFEADAGDDYEGSVGEMIQFYGSAWGGIEPYTWFWDFGDGENSTDQNPSHAYSSEGEFEVILTVTDDTGDIAIDETDVEIED